MNASNNPFQADFAAQAQRFWDSMSRAGNNAGSAARNAPGLQQLIGWWSSLAGGSNDQVDDAVERMNRQAGGWLGMMQQLAEKFAGNAGTPADIASAWKQMLSGSGAGANPFAQMFQSAAGPGANGFEAMNAELMSRMPSMATMMQPLLSMPAFGFAREHQERLQEMARAHAASEQAKQRYNGLLAKAGEKAYAIFERLLAERSEPGRQITSARGLFDLWIDAAEQGYAEVALSPDFRECYAELVGSQMRFRAGMQQQVELSCREAGMPTRSELDGSHRKVTELQREVRRLSRRLDALEAASGSQPKEAKVAPAAAPRKKATAAKTAARGATSKTKAASKPVARSTKPKAASSKSKASKTAKRTKAVPSSGVTPRAPAKSPANQSTAASRRARK